jgi:hypothetical protein
MPTTPSNLVLRRQLIRLAHDHAEFRKDLLPLIQACDHDHGEGPMMGKYEEGKPADPTENMSEADKKEWELNTLKHKDQFKAAEEESEDDEAKKEAALRSRLIRLAHANPAIRKDVLALIKKAEEESEEEGEKKEASARKAASPVTITKSIKLIVRILSLQQMPLPEGQAPFTRVMGQISIDFGGDIQPDAVRFSATVSTVGDKGDKFVVHAFETVKSVSGGGAEMLVNVLRAAFQEALDTKGKQLLGPMLNTAE